MTEVGRGVVAETPLLASAERVNPVLSRPEKRGTLEVMKDPEAFSWTTVLPELKEQVDQGKTIAVTNGHFVLFHPGHSVSLEQARQIGVQARPDHDDSGVVLLAIVNSDKQTALKDPRKASVQTARERATNVYDNRHSDLVVISKAADNDPTLVTDFQKLADEGIIGPNFVYIKGGDYGTEGANVPPEAKIVLEHGGKFQIVERVGDYSTSKLMTSLKA